MADEVVIPEDWAWTPIEVTCASCSQPNPLHEQPPELLNTVNGVKWECNHCGAANKLGGVAAPGSSTYVAECGHCHATFDPATIEVAEDGSWTCPACSTSNRDVSAGEHASSVESVEVGQ